LGGPVPDKVETAYRRSDLFAKRHRAGTQTGYRRQMMEAWARFCAAPPAVGRVVPLHRAK
jgi:hypothetical protein